MTKKKYVCVLPHEELKVEMLDFYEKVKFVFYYSPNAPVVNNGLKFLSFIVASVSKITFTRSKTSRK